MNIGKVLERKGRQVRQIGPETDIHAAIRTMVENNIGSLMVVGPGDAIIGIVTERDCLRVVARDPAGISAPVSDVMTRDIVIAEPHDDLGYVMDAMISKNCRHVPILENGKLAGMISIRDVVRERLAETRTELKFLREYLGGPSAG